MSKRAQYAMRLWQFSRRPSPRHLPGIRSERFLCLSGSSRASARPPLPYQCAEPGRTPAKEGSADEPLASPVLPVMPGQLPSEDGRGSSGADGVAIAAAWSFIFGQLPSEDGRGPSSETAAALGVGLYCKSCAYAGAPYGWVAWANASTGA